MAITKRIAKIEIEASYNNCGNCNFLKLITPVTKENEKVISALTGDCIEYVGHAAFCDRHRNELFSIYDMERLIFMKGLVQSYGYEEKSRKIWEIDKIEKALASIKNIPFCTLFESSFYEYLNNVGTILKVDSKGRAIRCYKCKKSTK